MEFGRRLGRMLGLARSRDIRRQFRGFTDQPVEFIVAWQLVDGPDLPELTHRADGRMAAFELLAAPEIQRRVRFKGRRDQHDFSANGVSGHAPFYGFLGVRQDGVNALADLLEDRPREGLRLCDIGVDARLAAHNMPPPRIRRTTPIRITSRFRFLPALPREISPTPAPTTASGTINQLNQPSSGTNATTAQTSATKPMISETRLNIASPLSSFRRRRQNSR